TVKAHAVEFDEGNIELQAERLFKGFLTDIVQLQEDGAQRQASLLLVFQSRVQLVLGEKTGFEQYITQLELFAVFLHVEGQLGLSEYLLIDEDGPERLIRLQCLLSV